MWTANLFQVTTGAMGPGVRFKDATWSVSLNSIESFTADISKADLPLRNLGFWLEPWWAGIVFLYDGVPVFAGPIVSRPTENFYGFRVECKGIRAIFERRFVINEQTDWTKLAASTVSYSGLTFGTIAQRVVKLSMAKPGGYLPINFPYPEQTSTAVDTEHKRTYEGYNLSNIITDSVLTKLSEVTDGPDIVFRPRLADGNSLVFDMLHGIDDSSPHIPQTHTPVWDTTAVNGAVTDLDIVTTGTHQTNRVFATGSGTNATTLIRMAQDTTPLAQGFPLLETTESYGEIKTPAVIQSHANANLKANSKKLMEIQLTVRADGEHKLGSFWPGHSVQLITKGWYSLSDGVHNLRLLNISGSEGRNVRMSLQTER